MVLEQLNRRVSPSKQGIGQAPRGTKSDRPITRWPDSDRAKFKKNFFTSFSCS